MRECKHDLRNIADTLCATGLIIGVLSGLIAIIGFIVPPIMVFYIATPISVFFLYLFGLGFYWDQYLKYPDWENHHKRILALTPFANALIWPFLMGWSVVIKSFPLWILHVFYCGFVAIRGFFRACVEILKYVFKRKNQNA